MPSENVKSRVRRGIVQSLVDLALDGFAATNIVRRKREILADIPGARGIVVSGGTVDRQRSPAGLQLRRIETLVTVCFKITGENDPDVEEQEAITEEIWAAFSLPPAMPESLVGVVPEAEECRVVEREMFVQAVYPFKADLHRFRITVEVCQTAGVAS